MNRLKALYQKVAREFAERVASELDREIQAVVLYGSVARGEAIGESDIDMLIVTPHKDAIRAKVVEIEEDIDSASNYQTFLTSIYLTPEEVCDLASAGSPYMLDVLDQGVVLYDDGSFAGIRETILAARRRDVGRRAPHAPTRTA